MNSLPIQYQLNISMLGLRKLQKNKHQNSTVKTYAAKVCSNCKYFSPDVECYYIDERFKFGLCTHKSSEKVDIITGDVDYKRASLMRTYKTHCGPDAQFYEADTKIFVILRTIRSYLRIRETMTNIAVVLGVMLAVICYCVLLIKKL